jgi:lysophospholipase L1-like esterase
MSYAPRLAIAVFFILSIHCIQMDNPRAVCFMGDSITSSGVFPDKVGRMLGAGWMAHNCGVSGESTVEMVRRFRRDVIERDGAHTVVVLGGVNDVRRRTNPPDEESKYFWTTDSIKMRLQKMYTDAHRAGIKVVAVTILPFRGSTSMTPHESWSAEKQSTVDDVNNWIMHTAIDIDTRIDAYGALGDPTDPSRLLPLYDAGDHLHLSDSGYTALASIVYKSTDWNAPIINDVGHALALPDDQLSLSQNFPNPFNPSTTISFYNPSRSFIELRIYNATGALVSTLIGSVLAPGAHSVQWNASQMPSGIYFATLRAGDPVRSTATRKIMLLK